MIIPLHRAVHGNEEYTAPPPLDSPNTSRRFALGTSNVGLVGNSQTCSVPAL